MLLGRLLTRLLGILLLALLALAGLAAAVFCIQSGHGTVSLPSLASDLHLADLRGTIATFLHRLEARGPSATVAALSGGGAILLGIVMIASLVPRRERLIVLSESENGVIAARRRVLAQAATALARQPRMVTGARARARPSRRKAGGRLRVRVDQSGDSPNAEVTRAVIAALQPLSESLPLRVRVRARKRRPAGRVR